MTDTRTAGDSGSDGRGGNAAAAGRDLGFLQRNPGLVPPMGLLVPLVLLAVLIYLVNPVFLDSRNLFNVFRQIAIFLVLGAGMTVVIAARASIFPSAPPSPCLPASRA